MSQKAQDNLRIEKEPLTLEKDKEDQSNYYLSYPKLPVLDMKWENCDINVVKYASSTKWRLGENVILWLRKCLTPSVSSDIFMDNYFPSFRLLTHLEVNNIRATGVLNENRLHKCTIIGDKQLQKRNVVTLSGAHQAKKLCNFDSGWL